MVIKDVFEYFKCYMAFTLIMFCANFRQYGFQMYLRELFVCPEAVMRYLCKNYHVHKIPVGTDYTKLHVDNVIKANPNLQTFYTENHKVMAALGVFILSVLLVSFTKSVFIY